MFLRTIKKLIHPDNSEIPQAGLWNPVRVRPMQIDDLELVHAIDELSFSMPWPASSYRFELLDNPSSTLWVADIEQPGGKRAVAGMCVVWFVIDEAHIATIAVHPDYRGRGIGKLLLAQSLRGALSKGARQVTLEVRVGNTIAQDMYSKFGFQVVGRRPKYYQDNHEDALIMTVDDLDEPALERMIKDNIKSQEV